MSGVESLYQQDVSQKAKHSEFIEHNFDFIYGHFWYDKYMDIFPEANYITCVREPVERLISYYHHMVDGADHLTESKMNECKFYMDLKSGRADIVDLAAHRDIGNLQSLYLAGRDIKEYDHVFINEKLAESVFQFQLRFDFERNDPFMNLDGEDSIPRFNVKSARQTQRPEISQHALEKVKTLLSEDYELYRRALEKFDAQSKFL